MDKAKLKRLQDAGWVSGSARDFLGLSDAESAYVELRLRVSDAVRMHRQAARITQSAFADLIESSQSRVAKMESNDSSVSLDLMIRSLISLGLSLEELGNIVSFQRETKDRANNQRTTHKNRRKKAA